MITLCRTNVGQIKFKRKDYTKNVRLIVVRCSDYWGSVSSPTEVPSCRRYVEQGRKVSKCEPREIAVTSFYSIVQCFGSTPYPQLEAFANTRSNIPALHEPAQLCTCPALLLREVITVWSTSSLSDSICTVDKLLCFSGDLESYRW